jgi:hypothetical protein
MKSVVFVGPTLSPLEVSEAMDAVCLPPVSQGDVYWASLGCPSVIGIVDGYFESVPSVWHKEILWAMSQGIHVFGSASMGALRAAELASFGMVGVGEIFDAYRDGVLEDDDEVAVVHGAAENGYRTASDAMVNIRSTLVQAQAQGIVDETVAGLLRRIAKELFYPERSYAHILDLAAMQQAPRSQLDALRRWLPHGAVNQKREDAFLMLRAMRDFLNADPGPKLVSWTMEETDFWDFLKTGSGEIQLASHSGPDAMVLEELRRDPSALARATAAALGWWLAAEQARQEGHAVGAADLLHYSAEFCHSHGLSDSADVAAWLEKNHCGQERLEHILASRALAGRGEALAPSALECCLLDYLRWTGGYTDLLARNGNS